MGLFDGCSELSVGRALGAVVLSFSVQCHGGHRVPTSTSKERFLPRVNFSRFGNAGPFQARRGNITRVHCGDDASVSDSGQRLPLSAKG